MFEELEDSGTPDGRDVKIVDELEEQEHDYYPILREEDAIELSGVVMENKSECRNLFSNKNDDVTWVGSLFLEDIETIAERTYDGDIDHAFGSRLDYISYCVSNGIKGFNTKDCTVRFEISYDDKIVKILCILNNYKLT